ncbi:MAG: hypothetical protein JWO06_1591 [Bacteroidota bacterium]|nr:hypothetical protein [Bacteroidota bacterium]
MKTPSPDLFQLIKSMNGQERKYFKQYAAKYSESRNSAYMLLFDAIDEQKSYDEEKIKKQFAGHDFVKQLSVAKNYLFEKLLDSLMEMYTNSDEALLIQKMIGRFEFLFRRNHIAPAIAFYNRAEQKANENGNLTLLPHITRQKNLMLARSHTRFTEKEWIENGMAAIEHTRILLNFLEYELLASRASVIFANPKFGYDNKLSRELESIMANPLFESEERALSFKAWHYFSKTKYRYLHVIGRHEECLNFIKNCIVYLNLNYVDNTAWQLTYFRTHSDLMNICVNVRKFEECGEIFRQLEKMIAEKYYPLPIIRQAFLYYKLLFHASSGQGVDEAIQFWIDNQSYWNEIKDKIEVPTRHSVMYDVLRLYFRKQDWQNAVITFNELIDHKTLNVFEAPARIYWLMLQYEIANMEILPGLTHNVREWFRKNKMMNPLEKVSLKFFERIPKATDRKEIAGLFEKLKREIILIERPIGNNESSVKYDLLEWIDGKLGKIKNRSRT